jgi:hypothetical protein
MDDHIAIDNDNTTGHTPVVKEELANNPLPCLQDVASPTYISKHTYTPLGKF